MSDHLYGRLSGFLILWQAVIRDLNAEEADLFFCFGPKIMDVLRPRVSRETFTFSRRPYVFCERSLMNLMVLETVTPPPILTLIPK